jgi:hypothetical protein
VCAELLLLLLQHEPAKPNKISIQFVIRSIKVSAFWSALNLIGRALFAHVRQTNDNDRKTPEIKNWWSPQYFLLVFLINVWAFVFTDKHFRNAFVEKIIHTSIIFLPSVNEPHKKSCWNTQQQKSHFLFFGNYRKIYSKPFIQTLHTTNSLSNNFGDLWSVMIILNDRKLFLNVSHAGSGRFKVHKPICTQDLFPKLELWKHLVNFHYCV